MPQFDLMAAAPLCPIPGIDAALLERLRPPLAAPVFVEPEMQPSPPPQPSPPADQDSDPSWSDEERVACSDDDAPRHAHKRPRANDEPKPDAASNWARLEKRQRAPAPEDARIVPIRANNAAGFQGVSVMQGKLKPYVARMFFDGKQRSLGAFATAEEAGLAYARALADEGAAERRLELAARLAGGAPPRAAPAQLVRTGDEAAAQAKREGLRLLPANTASGFEGVRGPVASNPRKPFQARVRRDGKQISLGYYATAQVPRCPLPFAPTPPCWADHRTTTTGALGTALTALHRPRESPLVGASHSRGELLGRFRGRRRHRHSRDPRQAAASSLTRRSGSPLTRRGSLHASGLTPRASTFRSTRALEGQPSASPPLTAGRVTRRGTRTALRRRGRPQRRPDPSPHARAHARHAPSPPTLQDQRSSPTPGCAPQEAALAYARSPEGRQAAANNDALAQAGIDRDSIESRNKARIATAVTEAVTWDDAFAEAGLV